MMRRRYLLWGLAGAAGVSLILLVTSAIVLRSGALKPRFTAALAGALNCDVTLDAMNVRVLPRITISGTGLSVRLRNRPELPPFIAASKFSVNLGLLSIIRRHVDTVELEELRITVPKTYASEGLPLPSTDEGGTNLVKLFTVDHLVAHAAQLTFTGRRKGFRPLVFAIPDLHLDHLALDHPMKFTSRVVNPIPEGPVDARGEFGPWRRDDPTLTPMKGTFTLTDADLGTINGMGGRVSSTGDFAGHLAEIKVIGTSESPDFSLDLGGRPQPLTTKFDVTVDGTDGTTFLNRVDALLIKTPIVAKGTIVNQPGPGRHQVHLIADVRDGRIEDLLRLLSDTPKPLIVGDVSMTTTVTLPPGPARVRDRVEFAGSFGLAGGRFTNSDVQAKMHELSRRGQGKGQDEVISRLATNVKGHFRLIRGIATFSDLVFEVPGATVSLTGTFNVGEGNLDLLGTIKLESSMSTAVGGFKSVFLKPFNALFRKEGAGAIIPIEITGTRDQPKLGVRMKAIFKRGGKHE